VQTNVTTKDYISGSICVGCENGWDMEDINLSRQALSLRATYQSDKKMFMKDTSLLRTLWLPLLVYIQNKSLCKYGSNWKKATVNTNSATTLHHSSSAFEYLQEQLYS
jgi:hypothetical protein